MPPNTENSLTTAEVEMVLRRAAEFSARRRGSTSGHRTISPEVLVQVAGALGIAEPDDGWTVIVWILVGAAVAGVLILALTTGLRRR